MTRAEIVAICSNRKAFEALDLTTLCPADRAALSKALRARGRLRAAYRVRKAAPHPEAAE
jgi:hypothetical protein